MSPLSEMEERTGFSPGSLPFSSEQIGEGLSAEKLEEGQEEEDKSLSSAFRTGE